LASRFLIAAAALLLVSACAEIGKSWPDAGRAPRTFDPIADTTDDGDDTGGVVDSGPGVGVDTGSDLGGTTGDDTTDVGTGDTGVGDDTGADDTTTSGSGAPGSGGPGPGGDDGPDLECNDKNPCTDDILNDDGQCEYNYIYGVCCTENGHCNDSDACTDDICVGSFCQHTNNCCESDADCADDEDICTVDTCVIVQEVPPLAAPFDVGYCLHQATGDPACCEAGAFIFDVNFDDGTLGPLTVQNLTSVAGWHVSVDGPQYQSPTGSLWYGNPEAMNYASGAANSGIVGFPKVKLPGGGVDVGFTFDLFLDIDTSSLYDKLELRVIEDGADHSHVVWHKGKAQAYNAWFTAGVNLAAWSGKTVTLQFVFETVDGKSNDTLGIFIDNIQMGSLACAPTTCLLDSECNDNLGVTSDFCVDGYCVYKQNPDFCTNYISCDDGDPCTYNSCSSATWTCSYPENVNCCSENSDCEDGNPCTVNDCVGAYSQYGGHCTAPVDIPGCCLTSFQCNDNNDCTTDSCSIENPAAVIAGECTNSPLPGCCTQHEDCADTNPCTEDLCVSGSCQNPVVCCASDAACEDGDVLCTTNTCVNGLCETKLDMKDGCCTLNYLSSTFAGGSWDGWSETEDSGPFDGVGWVPTSSPAKTPPGSLHYGGLTPGSTYDTGQPNSGTVESPLIVLPATAQSWLSFELLLDNEYSAGFSSAIEWDRLVVTAYRIDDPTQEIVVWDSADGAPQWWSEDAQGTPNGGKWTTIDLLDLTAFKGRSVRLKFRFDTVDEDANAFAGVYIDDVTVTSTCAP